MICADMRNDYSGTAGRRHAPGCPRRWAAVHSVLMNAANTPLLELEPVPILLRRLRAELAAEFDPSRPVRISRAPGRLDVMGGIADYTGSMVCELPLDRAAAVALQPRTDRQVQIFSFNLLDEHKPFTFGMSLDALAAASAETLLREFHHHGRTWAGYLAGCLYLLHEQKLVDLHDPKHAGVSIGLYSSVPLGAGVSSSAAIEVATMMNLVEHFGVRAQVDPMRVAAMCQQVENRIVGAPCGIMDQVTSCAGEAGKLLRLLCQPHELLDPLELPEGVRVLGINSNVKHSVGGGKYGRTRCAAFMGHAIILAKMREMGETAAKPLKMDPMNGYLANLDPGDFKRWFRGFLPETMKGLDFLEKYGPTIDRATTVHPDHKYHVQQATHHHVLESMRVRNFVQFLEEARKQPPKTREQGILLDKAGHLMYASHMSYREDALLGAEECDILVDLVRENEPAGLYGAKITGGGLGGTVAVMADASPRADEAIVKVMAEYEMRTGKKPEAFTGTSDGAWRVGTAIVAGE
jgi:galactokinase